MTALKSRFIPKKAARSAYSKNLLDGSSPKVDASEADHEDVSSVVVLGCGQWVGWRSSGYRETCSFAKTPLKAAHAPDVMAKKSHADLVGDGIVEYCVCCLVAR
jgi:ABC-type nickel/cobalt efflux system permease component RcnA